MNLLCGTIETEIVGIKVWTGTEWALLDLDDHPLVQVDQGLNETERDRLLMLRGIDRIVQKPDTGLCARSNTQSCSGFRQLSTRLLQHPN